MHAVSEARWTPEPPARTRLLAQLHVLPRIPPLAAAHQRRA